MARAKAVLQTVPQESRPRDKRARQPRPAPAPARKPYQRSYRQTVEKVDLWSVLKISICFYLCALILMLVAAAFLWVIASAFGVISNIENFAGDLLNSNDFHFLSWQMLRGTSLVGLVFVCMLVVMTVLAAAFYNLFSELLGGIEITVSEEE